MWFEATNIDHLRTVYNSEHPKETPIPSSSPEEIWKSLQSRFHKKCKLGKAECVISHMLSRPRAPESWIAKPTEWLSSLDIERVEKQYSKLLPYYNFLGCIPIDFDLKSPTGKCLVDALCSTKLQDLYNKGTRQIGIIFNTDVHTGPGQHWIALFCDLRPELEYPRITYFDSYAEKPEEEVQRLMKRWKESWETTKIHSKPMALTYNTTAHQRKDSECGMYCLYFHYCCLLEISMEERIPDDVIQSFRQLLFKIDK